MRNGQNVLWWILGIYFIFFVTSVVSSQQEPSDVVSEQSVESNVDTASDDSDLLQSQMTKIMEKIHEVEIGLRNYIDQKYLEIEKEGDTLREVEIGLRNYIDQKYAENKKDIETLGKKIEDSFKDQKNQIDKLDKAAGYLQISTNIFNGTVWALILFLLTFIFQSRR